MTTYDLKITGGRIIDGTGGEARLGDVGIKAGVIVALGECPGEAHATIDASGHIVTPGFIDLHTHYDGQISWDADLAPSCYHGVTTAVMGSCGVGFAPVREPDRERLIALMEGVEDIPGTALTEGLTWEWETLPEYMDAIDGAPHTIDFAVQVTHDPVRVYVMGDRAVADEPATDEEIAAMRAIVREALEAGAVGFSTGRTDNHLAADGSATPASEADVRELQGLAEALVGLDHGVLQGVSDFDLNISRERFDEEFDIFEKMMEAAPGHRMSISVMQRDQDTEQWRRIFERIERAQQRGAPLYAQVAARGVGVLLGLQATFHPFMGFPSYKRIAHLPLEQRVERMRQERFKRQLLSEKSDRVSGDGSPLPPLADEFLAHLDFIAMRLYRIGEEFDYEPSPERSLYAEAIRREVPFLEVIYDSMLERGGRELLYFPLYNYLNHDLEDVRAMMTHPHALPGLSDAGAHVGTVCDASFPTYMLTHWTRDRARGEKLKLERVVQMMTEDVARFIGFKDRGVIALGRRADLNVIDYEGLKIEAPYIEADLPAGGHRLLQRARGYRATIVAGEVIIDRDELTGQRPGRLVRLGQGEKA